MGSGSSFGESKGRTEAVYGLVSEDTSTRARAYEAYRGSTAKAREDIAHGRVKASTGPQRDTNSLVDPSKARNTITHPSKTAKRAVVVLVDNSGSNRAIAAHFLQSSGHFTAFARAIDPEAEVAFIYFSDHKDDYPFQYADFAPPTEEGDRQLFNSFRRIEGQHGNDEPEAVECALLRASEIDFGTIPVQDRTVVLVTDVVAHGMGLSPDDGCPDQVSWRSAMQAIRRTYGKFVLIGSGANPGMVPLQKQFFETAPGVSDLEEVARNFIDLSEIRTAAHRNGIVANAVLFCMARNAGKQSIQIFLASLYSKWLADPVFGSETDVMAQKRIRAFAELYLPGVLTGEEIQAILADILG